jgi:hypothetical protein
LRGAHRTDARLAEQGGRERLDQLVELPLVGPQFALQKPDVAGQAAQAVAERPLGDRLAGAGSQGGAGTDLCGGLRGRTVAGGVGRAR